MHAVRYQVPSNEPSNYILLSYPDKHIQFIKKTPPDGVVVSMIFEIENHGNPSHYDLHIENAHAPGTRKKQHTNAKRQTLPPELVRCFFVFFTFFRSLVQKGSCPS